MAAVQASSSVAMCDTYDSHSFVQMASNERHISLLIQALSAVNSPENTIVILDCGSATGLNSMKTFSAAIQAFRETSQTPIMVYHCDLPSNPWSVLFTNAISSPHSYLSLPNTYVAGIGRNYHSRVLPANSLSIAFSLHSLHWLSVRSSIRGQLQRYVQNDPLIHAELRALSDSDLDNFLSFRSEELKIGGRLVFQMNGSIINEEPRYSALLKMQEEGLITAEPIERYSIFVYPATPESIRTTVSRHSSLKLLSLNVLDVNDAVFRQYESDRDTRVYAVQYTRTMRAATEAMVTDLLSKEQGNVENLVNVFFDYMQNWVQARPIPILTREMDVVIEKVA